MVLRKKIHEYGFALKGGGSGNCGAVKVEMGVEKGNQGAGREDIPVFRVLEDVLDAIFPVLRRLWHRGTLVEAVGDEGWRGGLLGLGECHDGLVDGVAAG